MAPVKPLTSVTPTLRRSPSTLSNRSAKAYVINPFRPRVQHQKDSLHIEGKIDEYQSLYQFQ